MKNDFKRQLWIGLSVIVGTMIVASIALYFLAGEIATVTKKIVTDRSIINGQTGALAILASLKQDAPKAAIYQAAMDKLLPTQDGLVEFGQWLYNIGNTDHVSVNSTFQNNTVAPANGMAGTVGFSLEVDGPLDNVAKFLEDIESNMPGFLLHINAFDLVNNNSVYRLVGQGTVFFR